jgi:two-component system phosphate regulon sensor histidine kinase PhoR
LLNEAIRLSNLVQDLLDLKQIERGAPYCLNLSNLNLAELIQSAWLSLEPLARKKQLHFLYHGPDVVLIQADGPRLFRVLINLLDNSIRYSPSQQPIRVQVSVQDVVSKATDPPGQQVCLEVIDMGPGFPESALPFVFDRFYQVDPSRSRHSSSPPLEGQTSVKRIKVPHPTHEPKVETVAASHPTLNQEDKLGTASERSTERSQPAFSASEIETQRSGSSGLGLAIVRQIVEAHQGSVSANNHPETGGAWLQVFLPCQQPHPLVKS